MSIKTKKGLSYVLGDSNDNENHILPINAIQYSSYSSQVFSGGRDGTVKVWDPKGSFSKDDSPNQFNFNSSYRSVDYKKDLGLEQDIDEKVLKLETSISSNPLPYTQSPNEGYSIVNNYNIHFDWINDLKLVNNDRDLVSCSSDLSIKLINLNPNFSTLASNEDNYLIHKFPNVHTDYIKRLSYFNQEKLIVSGGLDGKVIVWDLNTLKPIQEIQNLANSSSSPNSVYSLANNSSHLISTGGPSNTINLYDKRISLNSKFIKKLIGHQDNIRCLLMNDRYILSGSSDTTIKLWDLRNFKVYKNFDIHDDAVWSLSTAISSAPGILNQSSSVCNSDFKEFYSGDKSGKIIKTDLSYLSSNAPEDYFPGSETFSSNDTSLIDEKLGLSTIIAITDSPIISLYVEANNSSSGKESTPSIFASNYMSLNRYFIPDTEQLSRYQYLRTCLDYTITHEYQVNDEIAAGLVENSAGEQNDINSDFYDLISHLSMDTNNFDIQSSFSGTNYPLSIYNMDVTNPIDVNDYNEYNSMFLNVNGGPSSEFVNAYKQDLQSSVVAKPTTSGNVDETPIEILLNPIPHEQITSIPFNKSPFEKFQLTPKSIISKRLFNNKRYMLVLYLNGDLKIWDIFMCKEIKTFPFYSNIPIELTKESLDKRYKEMDKIYQKYQTTDTLNNWCEVEIKAGKLMVTLKESTFTNLEIYYDDLIKDYPYLAYDYPDSINGRKNNKVKVANDDRFHISSILLNSLFHQYVLYEWEFDNQLREELKQYKKNNLKFRTCSSVDTNSVTNLTDSTTSNITLKKLKYFGRKSSRTSLSQQLQQQENQASPVLSAVASVNDLSISLYGETTQMSEFINFNEDIMSVSESANGFDDGSSTNSFNYEDSIIKLLQMNKKKYWEKYNTMSKIKLVDSLLKINSNDPIYHANADAEVSYTPLIPPQRLPPNLLIIIFEHSAELGNLRDVCSFKYEDITKIKFNSDNLNRSLINDLRNYLPRWVGQPILYDRYTVKESPKIAFQLLECDYSNLPPNKKIGGKSQRKVKKLPALESSIKLTSHNMLRVSKILFYLTEKFESRTSEMKDHKPPYEWLVLECKGEELSNNMTLQSIKTRIWKSSSDIELRFRRKFDN